MTVSGSFAGAVCGRARVWCATVVAWVCGAAAVCGAAEPDVDPAEAAFDAADANQDGVLACEEFESMSNDAEVARRDFRLFDFDRNGSLTWSEMRTIPGFVPVSRRAATPDPIDHLVEAAVDALSETWEDVQVVDRRHIDTSIFVLVLVRSMSPDHSTATAERWALQADPDGDRRVTPMEARRFLEIHLGLRAASGELLHERDGRVVDFGRFQQLDADGNGTVEIGEYLQGRDAKTARRQFGAIDSDQNGKCTLEEFRQAAGFGLFDPITWFRDADTNLDALVDMQEAQAATKESRQVLIEPSFHAFGDDHDGKLSLDEYRLSMLGNPIACWEDVPLDENEDDRLSFDEFRFGDAQCELLRLFYFHRFDADGNNTLSREEYPFRSRPPQKLQLLAADGREFRLLFADERYADIGSPAVSPDGERIAFDGHGQGETLRRQRILMMSIDGTGLQDVCAGLMPTWSKDGTQFACSRYEPRAGIWIVNADGSGERRISDGWAAQWSPDGASIAFTKNNALWVYEVESGKFREILSAVDNPYRTIYWNMCWSPDSRRLVFKASKARGCDIATVSMEGGEPDLCVHFSSDRSIKEDPAWSPDGSRIVVALALPQQERQLLCELDPITDEPPTILKGLDRSLTYEGCCFTPDGKWIIVQTAE